MHHAARGSPFPVIHRMSAFIARPSARRTHRTRRALASIALLPLAVLAACEGEADPTGPGTAITEAAINEIVSFGPLNASSTDTLVYFSFAAGALVPRSADWDLAFRRFEVRLNSAAIGGASSRNVLGVGLGNNRDASDAEVLALTPATTRAQFDAVRAEQIPADSLFVTDRLSENAQGMFTFGGIPVANASNYWKVRLANGAFALVRATRLKFSPTFAVDTLYLESRLQTGSTLGAVRTLAITPNRAVTAISLATNSVVSANGCNWDFSFDPAANRLAFAVNTACSTGTYPGPASPVFGEATTASDAPQYGAFLSQLVGPIPNSVFDRSAPFRYNLAGNDRLHPSFNVYPREGGQSRVQAAGHRLLQRHRRRGLPDHPLRAHSMIRRLAACLSAGLGAGLGVCVSACVSAFLLALMLPTSLGARTGCAAGVR